MRSQSIRIVAQEMEPDMTKIFTASAFALVATIGLSANPSFAAVEQPANSLAITFHDLDLATTAGQKKLERRIVQAAKQVCGVDQSVTGTRVPSASVMSCYRQALRDARTRVAEAIEHRRSAG